MNKIENGAQQPQLLNILVLAMRIGNKLVKTFNICNIEQLSQYNREYVHYDQGIWKDRNTKHEIAFLEDFYKEIGNHNSKNNSKVYGHTRASTPFSMNRLSNHSNNSRKIQNKTVIKYCTNLHAIVKLIKNKLPHIQKYYAKQIEYVLNLYQKLILQLQNKTNNKCHKQTQYRIETIIDTVRDKEDKTSLTRPSTTIGFRSSVLNKINKKQKDSINSLYGIQTHSYFPGKIKHKQKYSVNYKPVIYLNEQQDQENKENELYNYSHIIKKQSSFKKIKVSENEEDERYKAAYVKKEKEKEKQKQKQRQKGSEEDVLKKKKSKVRFTHKYNHSFDDPITPPKKSPHVSQRKVTTAKSMNLPKKSYLRDNNLRKTVHQSSSKKLVLSRKKRNKALATSIIKQLNKKKMENEEFKNYRKKNKQKMKRAMIIKRRKGQIISKKQLNTSLNSHPELGQAVFRNQYKRQYNNDCRTEAKKSTIQKRLTQEQNNEQNAISMQQINEIVQESEKKEKLKTLKIIESKPYQKLQQFHKDYHFYKEQQKQNKIESIFFKQQERLQQKQKAKLQKIIRQQKEWNFRNGKESFPIHSYITNSKIQKILKNQRDYAFDSDAVWIRKKAQIQEQIGDKQF